MNETTTTTTTQTRPPLGVPYLAFSGDTDTWAATKRFAKRFGVAPEHTIRWAGLIYVGPVPAATATAVCSTCGGEGGCYEDVVGDGGPRLWQACEDCAPDTEPER